MPPIVVCPDSPFVYLWVGGCWYFYNPLDPPLGEGAMGRVYLGLNCLNRGRVAIKRVWDEFAEIDTVRDCVRREASLIFRHPNIVRMIGLCEYSQGHGPLFVLSEYIAGETIKEYVAHHFSVLPKMERVCRIVDNIRPILSALQCLHDNGVVHRDVKPANIMIDSSSRVKLADLGIAGALSNKDHWVRGFVGTPRYAAPEQSPDENARSVVDGRTDIYSFGVTLYELITNENPFDGATEEEILWNQKYRELPPHPLLPPLLFAIIQRATEKSSDKRYGSAAEMNVELGRFLSELHYDGKSCDKLSCETKRILVIWSAVVMLLVLIMSFLTILCY